MCVLSSFWISNWVCYVWHILWNIRTKKASWAWPWNVIPCFEACDRNIAGKFWDGVSCIIFCNVLSNTVKWNPSWEANRLWAGQEIPRILRKNEGSLPHSQEPATFPYPEPNQPSPCLPHPTFPFLNSCQRISPSPRHLSCSQHDKFLWWGAISTSLKSQPEDAPCCGDMDPFVVAETGFR